jgi:HAD superfamily hydrolase (TIGR01509 family)
MKVDAEWDVDLYGVLLEIGGGKERMTHYFEQQEKLGKGPFLSIQSPDERKKLVQQLHLLKTDLFMELVETGAMPLRPGVQRLVQEAMAAGVKVAVCSTSNERAVSTIVRVMLGDEVAQKMRVFAGDIVPKKKPSPDIYNLAAKELGLDPRRVAVVEDSRIGHLAAKAAGMTCVVTKSSYTQDEKFDQADAIFDCIGDQGSERFSLSDLVKLIDKVEV